MTIPAPTDGERDPLIFTRGELRLLAYSHGLTCDEFFWDMLRLEQAGCITRLNPPTMADVNRPGRPAPQYWRLERTEAWDTVESVAS
jgi:hypothetical protein